MTKFSYWHATMVSWLHPNNYYLPYLEFKWRRELICILVTTRQRTCYFSNIPGFIIGALEVISNQENYKTVLKIKNFSILSSKFIWEVTPKIFLHIAIKLDVHFCRECSHSSGNLIIYIYNTHTDVQDLYKFVKILLGCCHHFIFHNVSTDIKHQLRRF